MDETTENRWERAQRHGRAMRSLMRSGPHEPLATREQVIEGTSCTVCRAAPGAECDGAHPHPAFAAGLVFGASMRGVHLRRYLDKTGDPR